MPRELTAKEFYAEFGDYAGLSPEKAEYVYNALVHMIQQELITYGRIKCPNFGIFTSKYQEAKIVSSNTCGGMLKKSSFFENSENYVTVDPYYRVSFKASTRTKAVLNNRGVSAFVEEKAKKTVRDEAKEKELQQQEIDKQTNIYKRQQEAMAQIRKRKAEKEKQKQEMKGENSDE